MLRRKVVAAVEGEICFMEEELGGGKVSAEIFARSNWQKKLKFALLLTRGISSLRNLPCF